MNYLICDAEGYILREVTCPAEQLQYQFDASSGEFAKANVGNWNDEDHYWDGTQFTTKPTVVRSNEELIAEVQLEIRRKRSTLLQSSDWTQVPDAPVDKAAWATYRQQLRDLPAQYQNETDFANVVWPTPPQ